MNIIKSWVWLLPEVMLHIQKSNTILEYIMLGVSGVIQRLLKSRIQEYFMKCSFLCIQY